MNRLRCSISYRAPRWLRRLAVSAGILALTAITNAAGAEEVRIQYNGLMLNADLQRADDGPLSGDVFLITHGGLAHRGAELIVYLQNLLKEKNHSSLAVNLSLGLDDRHGMYDCAVAHRHSNDDAADEIGVWLNWLREQGAQRVVLLGHSRGGAQTALFAAEHDDALIKAIVLLAPATRANGAESYARRYGKSIEPVLTRARALVAENKGETMLENVGLLNCADTAATARSFVSYYTNEDRLDTPSLIPKFTKPALVVIAGGDEVVVNLGDKLASLVDGARVQANVVDGSDHFFRDLNADDAVEAIESFLSGVH